MKNLVAVVKDTDIWIDEECFLRFDSASHATAYADGFNCAIQIAKNVPLSGLRLLRESVEEHEALLIDLNVPTPWHAGFKVATSLIDC